MRQLSRALTLGLLALLTATLAYASQPAVTPDTKARIDAWIKAHDVNQYGDPKDTVYAGGTPLFNETTGEQLDRYQYILRQHPELAQASGQEAVAQLGGVTILRFRVPVAGYSPQERLAIFRQRLDAALKGRNRTVSVACVGGEPVISLGGRQLVTVTATDAQANGSTLESLASDWAANVRRAVVESRGISLGRAASEQA